ncbi:MAG: hypothetical protein HQM01_05505 [Magnetococcales bacterium]|nr:hypothetical protein [Magnetococcales bacterium]
MWRDPIVEEIHQCRAEHAARFHHDLDAILDDLQQAEKAPLLPVVTLTDPPGFSWLACQATHPPLDSNNP